MMLSVFRAGMNWGRAAGFGVMLRRRPSSLLHGVSMLENIGLVWCFFFQIGTAVDHWTIGFPHQVPLTSLSELKGDEAGLWDEKVSGTKSISSFYSCLLYFLECWSPECWGEHTLSQIRFLAWWDSWIPSFHFLISITPLLRNLQAEGNKIP